MNPIYVFKSLPESVRAVGLVLLVYGAVVLTEFEVVTDWKAYAAAVGVGFLHVLGAAILAQVKR